ncbi:MAG: IS4 family transposase [Gemmataceae bacterium]
MTQPTPLRQLRQAAQLRRKIANAPALPFSELLPGGLAEQAIRDQAVSFRDRLFCPLVTLWVFLSQVLDSDHSCRAAVARFLAWRTAQGLAPCSADPSAYNKARHRLPQSVLTQLTRLTGRQAQQRAAQPWRWNGRTLKVVDGSTVSMPDRPAHQKAYPQSRTQKAGVGVPIARMVVLFSLAVGTVLDAALGRYQGKHTGETALWHSLYGNLEPDDLLLADRYYGSYWELALTRQRGADMVCRLHQRRHADFRRGRRLGRDDHVVCWSKPPRPEWMDEATYAALPALLAVRQLRVWVGAAGFRTKVLVVATTLLDAAAFASVDLALLYRMRWYAELDLRALKQTMQMDILRCQSPEMVQKEVWAHLLAYNLLRSQMTRAAEEGGLLPLQVSFKGALQVVSAFAAVLWTAELDEIAEIMHRLREAIRSQRVGQRANRCEPRARKRRPKHYPLLNESRQDARSRLGAASCS